MPSSATNQSKSRVMPCHGLAAEKPREGSARVAAPGEAPGASRSPTDLAATRSEQEKGTRQRGARGTHGQTIAPWDRDLQGGSHNPTPATASPRAVKHCKLKHVERGIWGLIQLEVLLRAWDPQNYSSWGQQPSSPRCCPAAQSHPQQSFVQGALKQAAQGRGGSHPGGISETCGRGA